MFHKQLARIHNSGISRTVVLCGNIYDMFYNEEKNEYLPLISFLYEKAVGPLKLVYELNGPIRMKEEERLKLRDVWIKWKTSVAGISSEQLLLRHLKEKNSPIEKFGNEFDQNCMNSIGNPTCALEFMRQISMSWRQMMPKDSIIFFVEAADMLLPTGKDIASMSDVQLHRISIVQDWICEPSFINGLNTLVLVSESRSLLHERISRLPHLAQVEVPYPNIDSRKMLLKEIKIKEVNIDENVVFEIGKLTAGLSLYAIRQLTKMPFEDMKDLREQTIHKVEQYIQSQLGEDVVEFKKPTHTLKDCVGFSKLKNFLKEYLIPRFKSTGDDALPGAAVAGSIGGGKTFLFEAVAAECDMLVLVLKNIRSQWFGQTDVIFERLRRLLEALDKVLIFVDEADAQFGKIGADAHETERRLTSKIQTMMSDTTLKGKVFWLLMTARIYALSEDIRRPGRVGDLIIPVLDPIGEDRLEFIRWALKSIKIMTPDGEKNALEIEGLVEHINEVLEKDYSSASFSSLRSNLKYRKIFQSEDGLFAEIKDFIQPAIATKRRYQMLQAIANTTRLSLIPEEFRDIKKIEAEIRLLELAGVK
jgi:hypothetical protein